MDNAYYDYILGKIRLLINSGDKRLSSISRITNDNAIITDVDGFTDFDFTTGDVNRTCALPELVNNIGRTIIITKVDNGSGKVTVNCYAGDFFLDGSTSLDLSSKGSLTYVRASTNGWKKIV